MPRRKREERYLVLECVQCNVPFDAVREDAKTCSAKCRVAFYRDRKAAAKHAKKKELRLSLVMVCKKCGHVYDAMDYYKCLMCGALECRAATNDEHVAYHQQRAEAATNDTKQSA